MTKVVKIIGMKSNDWVTSMDIAELNQLTDHLERVYVTRVELPTVLDEHADKVVERLTPHLDAIKGELAGVKNEINGVKSEQCQIKEQLNHGSTKFILTDREIADIKNTCEQRHAVEPHLTPTPFLHKPGFKYGVPIGGGGTILVLLSYLGYLILKGQGIVP